MADPIVFNVAKNNVDESDLRVLLLVGYVPDADHATVTEVIAAATRECAFTNYERKSLTGEAFDVDTDSDVGLLLADDPPTWVEAGGEDNELVSHAVVFEYHDADDDLNIPVTSYEVNRTTNGADLELDFTAGIVFATI